MLFSCGIELTISPHGYNPLKLQNGSLKKLHEPLGEYSFDYEWNTSFGTYIAVMHRNSGYNCALCSKILIKPDILSETWQVTRFNILNMNRQSSEDL